MTTAPNDWIEFRTRKPQDDDYPLWVATGLVAAYVTLDKPYAGWTHWQRAIAPAPPPREPSQAEADQAALEEWKKRGDSPMSQSCELGVNAGWLAALKWERGQVRELLAGDVSLGLSDDSTRYITSKALKQLAKRIGLTA